MPKILITTSQENLKSYGKEANKRLVAFMSLNHDTPFQRYHRLKKGIEIYLVHVESEVVVRTPKIKLENDDRKTQIETSTDSIDNYEEIRYGFRDYFRKYHKGLFSIDVFLDAIDPSKLHHENADKIVSNYFQFSEKLDDKVSDDVTHVWKDDFEELLEYQPSTRLHQILRSLGSAFYINRAQTEVNRLRELEDISWSSTLSLSKFVSQFNTKLKLCNEQGLITLSKDQRTLFRHKNTTGRADNTTIHFCLKQLEKLDDDIGILDYMQYFVKEMSSKYADGLVPRDASTFIGNTSVPGKSSYPIAIHASQVAAGICFHCAQPFPHNGKCPALTHKCAHCAREGHFELCCMDRLVREAAHQANLTKHQDLATFSTDMFTSDAFDPYLHTTEVSLSNDEDQLSDFTSDNTDFSIEDDVMTVLNTEGEPNFPVLLRITNEDAIPTFLTTDFQLFNGDFTRVDHISFTSTLQDVSLHGIVMFSFENTTFTIGLEAFYNHKLPHSIIHADILRRYGFHVDLLSVPPTVIVPDNTRIPTYTRANDVFILMKPPAREESSIVSSYTSISTPSVMTSISHSFSLSEPLEALLDSGANCFFSKKINATASTIPVPYIGIARFQFSPDASPVQVEAFYVPNNRHNILPGFGLQRLGYQIDLNLQKSCLHKEQNTYPVYVKADLPFVHIFPTPKPAHEVNNTTADRWHQRCMHLSPGILRLSGLPHSTDHSNCHVCLETKSKFRKIRFLDPTLKNLPRRKGTHIALDLLIPKHAPQNFVAGIRAAMIIIDCHTRFTYAIEVRNYTQIHLLEQLLNILVAHQLTPSDCIADRQSAFAAPQFRTFLSSRTCRLRLVPRGRHTEFNGIVERAIGTLRPMTRAAMISSSLDSSFWYFAVTHAIFVRNRLFHTKLKTSPYKKHMGRHPNMDIIRRFGALCFVHKHRKTDKFDVTANAAVFLGFVGNNASSLSCITYCPQSKRISIVHLTDVRFDEFSNYSSYKSQDNHGLLVSLEGSLPQRTTTNPTPHINLPAPTLSGPVLALWSQTHRKFLHDLEQKLPDIKRELTWFPKEVPAVPSSMPPPGCLPSRVPAFRVPKSRPPYSKPLILPSVISSDSDTDSDIDELPFPLQKPSLDMDFQSLDDDILSGSTSVRVPVSSPPVPSLTLQETLDLAYRSIDLYLIHLGCLHGNLLCMSIYRGINLPSLTPPVPVALISDAQSPTPALSSSNDVQRQQVVLRAGRIATFYPYDDADEFSTFVPINTSENRFHVPKQKTPGQKKRLIKKILLARTSKTPGIFADLRPNSINREAYVKAARDEFATLSVRRVLSIIPRSRLPSKVRLGTCTVLLNTKRCGRIKARCVYNGRRQVQKLLPSFHSPTLAEDSLKLALALAAHRKWDFITTDVKCAFPYAILPRKQKLFTEIPLGHPKFSSRADNIMVLHKNLYGTREGPLIWFQTLSKNLVSNYALTQSAYDQCMFYNQNIIVLTYVDDFLVLGTKKEILKFRTKLATDYEITSTKVNAESDFLGISIGRKDSHPFILHQRPYLQHIFTKFPGIMKFTPHETPLPVDIHRPKFSRTSIPPTWLRERYKEIIGSLLYLRFTRPELLHALQLLSQYAQSPPDSALWALEHCLGYLVQSVDFVYTFHWVTRVDRLMYLVAFSDATWATNRKSGKSLGANMVFLGSFLVYSSSKEQRFVATSSAAAELCQLFVTAKKLHTAVVMLKELGVSQLSCSLFTDSLSSVCTLSKNLQQKQKHLGLYIAYIRELQERFGLKVLYIQRNLNLADINTTQPSKVEFLRMFKWLSEPFEWKHVIVNNHDGNTNAVKK